MFKAFILICAMTLSHEQCDFNTARVFQRGEPTKVASDCMFRAQHLIASSPGIWPGKDEYVKVGCKHESDRIAVGQGG